MRLSLVAIAALALAAPAAARGEEKLPASVGEPVPAAPGLALPEAVVKEQAEAKASTAARSLRPPLPRWGLSLGAGFPDFATASLVFRPLTPVRVHAGPSWNSFGWGLQGGVTVVPWSFVLAPLASVEAGRFFGSDVSFLAKGKDGAGTKPLLRDVVYSYAAADVGVEIGSQRRFCFTFKVGLSYVSVAAHGTATRTTDGGTVVQISNPALNATLPSAKLGFQYWF